MPVINSAEIEETAMAFGTNIRTFWEGRWHDADLAVAKLSPINAEMTRLMQDPRRDRPHPWRRGRPC